MDRLSAEIFRDDKTPCADPRIVLPGLEYINKLTAGKLRLINGTREITLTSRSVSTVTPDGVEGLISEARPLSIVVTDRPIEIEGTNHALGFTKRIDNISSGIAVISTHESTPLWTNLAVAHEIGHLLRMQYGKGEPAQYHCEDSSCLMSSRIQQTEHHGKDETYYGAENQTFCHPCSRKIGRRAFYMLRYHQGLFVEEALR